MTVSLLLFFVLAVVLILLLAWALRPPPKTILTPEEALEALGAERHYARLPQILQALRKDDTEYLRQRGRPELLAQLRTERKRIALDYLNYLEEEFQVLLECARILATLAPELTATGEFERFRKSTRFVLCCRYLRWRLRLGLQPWGAFGVLSDMAGDMTLQLEATTARMAEGSQPGGDSSLFSDQRNRGPR